MLKMLAYAVLKNFKLPFQQVQRETVKYFLGFQNGHSFTNRASTIKEF